MERSVNNPLTTAVSDEWSRLVSTASNDLSLEEKMERWRKLYDTNFSDGQWTVSADDAGLIASLGNSLALNAKDYGLARDLAAQWLAHPDVVHHPYFYVSIAHFWTRLAMADILLGDVDVGLHSLRRGLTDQPFSFKYELIVRQEILHLLRELGFDEPPDSRIVAFVAEVIGLFPRCKGRSKAALGARTHGELHQLLLGSFKRRPD